VLRPYRRPNAAKGRRELGEDERIAGAAAGDNELVDFMFAENETI